MSGWLCAQLHTSLLAQAFSQVPVTAIKQGMQEENTLQCAITDTMCTVSQCQQATQLRIKRFNAKELHKDHDMMLTCVICVHVCVLRSKVAPLEAIHRPKVTLLPV